MKHYKQPKNKDLIEYIEEALADGKTWAQMAREKNRKATNLCKAWKLYLERYRSPEAKALQYQNCLSNLESMLKQVGKDHKKSVVVVLENLTYKILGPPALRIWKELE